MRDDIEMLREFITNSSWRRICPPDDQEREALAALERLEKERNDWKKRAQQFQRERAELADKLNGTPCAEIRWQQERDALCAELDRSNDLLREAASKTLSTRSALRIMRDAWRKSAELAEAYATDDPQTPAQWRAFGVAETAYAYADELDPEKDDKFEPCELTVIRAQFERAKGALRKIDSFEVTALDSMVNQVFRLKNMARAALAELSADAPARQSPRDLTVTLRDDGCWLNFCASTGKYASLRVEALGESRGRIIGNALLDWCADRRSNAPMQQTLIRSTRDEA